MSCKIIDSIVCLSKQDRVLCHFCFKQKRAVSKTFGLLNARKSQITIAHIILLKTALLALPLLLKVLKNAKSFMFCNFCKTLSENMKYDGIMKRERERAH
ncbi:hypothetical protein EJ110_NYTH57954 [Nymphaea thermarum]|nr:hypothetical protein EJ110_NYTH57954 [Nymphaea thermarum]